MYVSDPSCIVVPCCFRQRCRQPPSGEPRYARCRRIFDSIWAELALHGFLGAEPPGGSNDVHQSGDCLIFLSYLCP